MLIKTNKTKIFKNTVITKMLNTFKNKTASLNTNILLNIKNYFTNSNFFKGLLKFNIFVVLLLNTLFFNNCCLISTLNCNNIKNNLKNFSTLSTNSNFESTSNFSAVSNKNNLSLSSKYITYTYAQILQDEVYLFKTTQNTLPNNAYFEIPKTYFVMILTNIDEIFYKVQYRDIVGYVQKNLVNPVAETPEKPYLEDITFRVYTTDGTTVFSSPFGTQNATQSTTQTVNTFETLNYYGKICADEFVSNRGTTWYFAKTTNNSTIGYFYAGYCDSLSLITPNTETLTFLENPFEIEDNDYLYSLANISSELKIILIVVICMPCVFVVLLLFKPFKIKKNNLELLKKNTPARTQALNKIQKIVDEDDVL